LPGFRDKSPYAELALASSFVTACRRKPMPLRKTREGADAGVLLTSQVHGVEPCNGRGHSNRRYAEGK